MKIKMDAKSLHRFRETSTNIINAMRLSTRHAIKKSAEFVSDKLKEKIRATTDNDQPPIFYIKGKTFLRPRKYADTISTKVTSYKDGKGYIGISGSIYKDAPHAMLVEKGIVNKIRERKKIGGKFSYVEALISSKVLPLFKENGISRRQTGRSPPGQQTKLVEKFIRNGSWVLIFKQAYLSKFKIKK